MSPPNTSTSTAQSGLRQAVRMPRESDGVGNALRQIFGDGSNLPTDFKALLGRLDDH